MIWLENISTCFEFFLMLRVSSLEKEFLLQNVCQVLQMSNFGPSVFTDTSKMFSDNRATLIRFFSN